MILERDPLKDDVNAKKYIQPPIMITVAKRKNIRKYFSHLFKEVEEKLDAIPTFRLTRPQSKFAHIEPAIDFDEMSLESSTIAKNLAKLVKPSTKGMLQNIGDRERSSVNWEKVDLDVTEESTGAKTILEIEKCKILNEENYNDLDASVNAMIPIPVSAPASTGFILVSMWF